jgi:hypothetical protein
MTSSAPFLLSHLFSFDVFFTSLFMSQSVRQLLRVSLKVQQKRSPIHLPPCSPCSPCSPCVSWPLPPTCISFYRLSFSLSPQSQVFPHFLLNFAVERLAIRFLIHEFQVRTSTPNTGFPDLGFSSISTSRRVPRLVNYAATDPFRSFPSHRSHHSTTCRLCHWKRKVNLSP